MTVKQLRTVADFETRAEELGHDFVSWQEGPFEVRMRAVNSDREVMLWEADKDGRALVIQGDDNV